MKGRILFVVLAVTCFALDRVTKMLVETNLALGEQVRLVGDLLQLRHTRNSGIAFGLLADAGRVVVVGSLLVGVLLFVFMLRVRPTDYLTICGGALITGGALGNLVDRLQYHYVVDFLHLPSFPTFNVADVCITFGVAAVLLAQLLELRHELRTDGDAP